MSDIKILAAGKEQADIVSPFIGKDALNALKASLPITVLAAVDKDGVMGVLAGAMDQDVFMIDSLFVDPGKRRLGAGRALIECLDGIFPEGNIAVRVEFNIENKDNETLPGFLRAMYFEEEDIDYPMYYLGSIRDLRTASAKKPEKAEIRSFSDTDEKLLKAVAAKSVSEGNPLPEGGLLSKKTDTESSFCIIEDGKISAYVVVENVDDELLKIAALYSSADDPRETIYMINCMVETIKGKYYSGDRVAMLALSPLSKKVIDFFFEETVPVSRSFIKFL